MRLSFVAIFLLIVGTVLSVVYWKVDQDFFSEKILWNEAQSRSELAALSRSIESELEGFSQILDLAYPSLRGSQKNYGSDQVYSHFQMIAKLNEVNGEVNFEQKFFLEGTPVQNWGENYTYLVLKGLRSIGDRTNLVLTILDPEKKPWLLVLTSSRVTQNQYAAILPASAFQGIVDRQKGQLNSVAILNSKAQVLGHTVSEYVGSSLNEDPLVKDILKSGNASGSGIYNGLQNERVQGFYEQVTDSNIFVTVSTPLKVLLAERGKIKTHFIYMGIGISLLGLAMMMLLGGGEQQKYSTSNSVGVWGNQPTVTTKVPEIPKFENKPLPPQPIASSKPMQPPPINNLQQETAMVERTVEKFDSLFGEKKLQEAFSTIDNLESIPQPPPISPRLSERLIKKDDVVLLQSEDSAKEKTILAELPPLPNSESIVSEHSMPPPHFQTAEPKIQINRKSSKLDNIEVQVRKPGKKNDNPSSSEEFA